MGNAICSFAAGTLRIVLMASCLILVYNRLSVQENLQDSELHIPGSRSEATSSYYSASVLFLAILGAFGAFYKSLSCLRLFVYLEFLNVAILFILFVNQTNVTLVKENQTFFDDMDHLMPWYDIRLSHGQGEANRKWDELQERSCCGLSGPEDWHKVLNRPGVYPYSCCQPLRRPTDFCSADNGLVGTGCVKRVGDLQDWWAFENSIDISKQAILCLIAYMLLRYYESSLLAGGQVPSRPVESRNDRIAAQVDRINTVLIYDSNARDKPPTTSYYPSLHNARWHDYSGPPPAYGAC